MAFWRWKPLLDNAGQIIFNEIAPRPHNSFHWTIEGCVTSQFAQLVRIITGLGPGDTSARGRWRMDNLLGEDLHRCLLFMPMQIRLFISMERQKRGTAAKWVMSPGSCGEACLLSLFTPANSSVHRAYRDTNHSASLPSRERQKAASCSPGDRPHHHLGNSSQEGLYSAHH